MTKINLFFCLFLFTISACKAVHPGVNRPNKSELIFQSGFEDRSIVVNKGANDADIIGTDETFRHQNDWVNDFDNHPVIGNFSLQFHKGDTAMRNVKIVNEPGNPKNKVLRYWLNLPSAEQNNGRIQANLYNGKGLKEFYQSVRLFLPDDFNTVRTYPKEIHWLTISEFWNNITWSQKVPYGFRITLGIGKTSSGDGDLRFILDAQDCQLFADGKQKYTTIWAETNKAANVPVGKWFTMEYYYKEGDSKNGRYYMAITPEGERRQVIFNGSNITHNTSDPNPDGVSDFNPMKLYTSKELVNYVHEKGKTLQVYWDDYKLWKGKPPF